MLAYSGLPHLCSLLLTSKPEPTEMDMTSVQTEDHLTRVVKAAVHSCIYCIFHVTGTSLSIILIRESELALTKENTTGSRFYLLSMMDKVCFVSALFVFPPTLVGFVPTNVNWVRDTGKA
ncbi:hypothetical protein AMECASPLE_031929 [Ameca splendens]|uniref:Uncharacterized protein n=1 Tax=Ameca splendens TaxID=208324 RepID=A0ABV0Y6U1_9TELE